MTRKNDRSKRAPSQQPDLLYGHNDEEHIVAVQQLSDSFVRIYKRVEGNIQHQDVEYFPFFFLSDTSLLQGFQTFHWLKELSGSHFFKHLVVFKRWSEMWEAVNSIILSYNKQRRPHALSFQDVESLLLRPDPVYQYLMQSGKTLFKGMLFDDVHRLQIDVQVYSRDRRRQKAIQDPDRITCLTLSDNRQWRTQLDSRRLDEKAILEQCIALIVERDPDVVEGHELFTFVLPNLVERCEQQGVDLALGRDGSSLKTYQKRYFSEEERVVYECAGRHFIDTLHLIRSYDYSRRTLESFDLPHIAEHFDIALQNQMPASGASVLWEEQPESVLQRSSDNTRIIQAICDRLSPVNFNLAQMCPYNYGTITELGSSAKLESLLVREYLRQRHSIPQPQKGSQSLGGYANIYTVGVLENVLQADIESLYPSIMISRHLRPNSDDLDALIPLLTQLTGLRLDAKRKMSLARTGQTRSIHDALQSALKILINSFYGYMGYSRGLFNDYAQADIVTSQGQQILTTIIHQIELFNAEPIEADTDGIFFVPPDNIRGESDEKHFVARISDQLPNGINLILSGRFKKMLSYKMKNYALLDHHDSLTVRGAALSSRSLERFARQYIRRCIECLLTEDIAQLHHAYASCYTRIKQHSWNAMDFCKTETLRENLDTYINHVAQGKRHASAAYEATRRAGIYVKSGERISYYVTGSQADLRISDYSRVVEEWDPNLPDENTAYYLARLEECSNKFKDLFEPEDFKKIFSLDDLFGFNPKDIHARTVKVAQEQERREPKEAEESEDFSIWIEDQT